MKQQGHVVVYTEDPDEGGVAIYNHSMVCGLAKHGYPVTLVQTKVDNPLIEEQKKLGVRHYWMDYHTRLEQAKNATGVAEAERALSTTKPDVVLFTNCSPYSHIAAKNVAVRRNIPYIVVEGYVTPLSQVGPDMAWYLYQMAGHYQKARAVIAVSQDNLHHLRQSYGLPANKGEIIYYGRPLEYFADARADVRRRVREEFDIPADAVLCLSIARMAPVKGYQHQLDALRLLKDRPIWLRLYFAWVGGGALETSVKDALQQLGVDDHVRVLGQRWDIPDWLDASDIFLLPSHYEGMPLAIMEALAKGLPVMATAVSGIPEELGNTGKLLTNPVQNAQATVQEIAATLEAWAGDDALRSRVAAACKVRGQLFHEERMVRETIAVIDRALLPAGDYVSPGLEVVRPDRCFPNMAVIDARQHPWPYLRREIPHNWYADRRTPGTGFLNRDEASILYNTALRFRGKLALEIGCWLGWSACHLALGGVQLDVIDPVLGRPDFLESVRNSLTAAAPPTAINLVAGASPQAVEELAAKSGKRWSLFFIDGNHDAPFPLYDTAVCAEFAEPDCLMIFHDLTSPDVGAGLDYLKHRGWNTLIYQTTQIMGVGWRGNVTPVQHVPDPTITWTLPPHLRGYKVSGLS